MDSPLTDEQVAALVQDGDKESFGILMERYQEKLSRYGRKFLSSRENIEDIVQDVFMNTYRNIKSFDPSLKFSSWIYRIAHNAFVNSLKKNQKSPMTFFDFDTLLSHPVYENPEERVREQEEIKREIEGTLEKLSPKYKEILILHYLEELSYKEISDILEIPVGTVGVRVKRGKDAMRAILEKESI